MKTNTITIHHEITINIGNYQNRKVGVGMTAELEDGESWHEASAQLSAQVAAALAAEAAPIVNTLYGFAARDWRERLGIEEPEPEPEPPLELTDSERRGDAVADAMEYERADEPEDVEAKACEDLDSSTGP